MIAYLPLLELRLHFLTVFKGKTVSVSQRISLCTTIPKGSADTRLNTPLFFLKDRSYASVPRSTLRLKTKITPIAHLIAYLLSVL